MTANSPRLPKKPQASETAECESFNRLVAEGEHIMNAEIALFNAGIPFLQLPFQQNKFASNLFMVMSVPKAKAACSEQDSKQSSIQRRCSSTVAMGKPSNCFRASTGCRKQRVSGWKKERINA